MDLITRIAYAVTLGVAQAWLEMRLTLRQAIREVPDHEMDRVRNRFRDAVKRLRDKQAGDPRSSLPS